MVLKSLIEKCSHDSSLPINVSSENRCFQRSTSTSGIVKKPIRERSPTAEGFLERAPPIPENLSRKNPLILWKLRSPPLTHSWSSPNFLNSHLGWQRLFLLHRQVCRQPLRFLSLFHFVLSH